MLPISAQFKQAKLASLFENNDKYEHTMHNFAKHNTPTKPQNNVKKFKPKNLSFLNTIVMNDVEKNELSNGLRERLLTKLDAAQFRLMNQKLCTLPPSKLKSYFRKHPDSFKLYHKTYTILQASWPEKPVEKIIYLLKNNEPKNLILADMGCGEQAFIAQKLSKKFAKIHSFDLVSTNPLVTQCEMSKVPLDSKSVDIVVFCLSLLGTNISPYITEANRILKRGGKLYIAELASRFEKLTRFLNVMEKFGFTIDQKDQSNDCFWILVFIKTATKNSQNELLLKPFLYKKR